MPRKIKKKRIPLRRKISPSTKMRCFIFYRFKEVSDPSTTTEKSLWALIWNADDRALICPKDADTTQRVKESFVDLTDIENPLKVRAQLEEHLRNRMPTNLLLAGIFSDSSPLAKALLPKGAWK